MNIGQAAQATGISAKMIRYYESIDLIAPSQRSAAGYRSYTGNDLHALHFIRRGRKLGFSLGQLRELMSLWRDAGRASADVKQIALRHVAELERRIAELTTMRDSLSHLAQACHGDHKPDCPILQELAMPLGEGCCADDS
jgi:MerR family copper efflux transcriptional regulator